MSENTTAGRKEIATKNVDDVNKDIEKYADGNNVLSCSAIFESPSKERMSSDAGNNGGNNDGSKRISDSIIISAEGKIGLIDNLLINQGALIHPGDSKRRVNKKTQEENSREEESSNSENTKNSIEDDGMSK